MLRSPKYPLASACARLLKMVHLISNPTRNHLLSVGLVVVFQITAPATAKSQEITCGPPFGMTQFFNDMTVCTTSVLPPQSKNHYGPEQLSGDRQGAWCEGVHGDGQGEKIIFYFSGAASPHQFFLENGYVKSSKAYRRNGRVAAFVVRDDAGHVLHVTVADTPAEQSIKLPWRQSDISWIEFEILDVYPGTRYHDTCISFLGPNFEAN